MTAALLLVLVVALPATSAGLSLAARPARRRVARASISLGIATATVAALLAGFVFTSGPVSAVFTGGDAVVIGLAADEFTAIVLLLVTTVNVVVQAFASRYLLGDPSAPRFLAGASVLTAASAAMVASATLIGLAVAWTIASAALVMLLRLYAHRTDARLGARRTVRAFIVGDGALWLAVVVATATWGTLDLRTLSDTAPRLVASAPGTTAVVACLLVIAALARSAQLPFQRWLPATLAAPTPVSALLHAGVVNAGGILLIKLSPLFGASAIATHLAFVAGGATVIYGTSLMLVKPDIKGALAHSTMGQMGFMVMTCGLGAFAAAAFHLVAHGMFKAALFLGSGSAVAQHARTAKAPPRPALAPDRQRLLLAIAGLVPAVVLGLAIVALPGSERLDGAEALLLFAWATGSAMAWGWMRSRPTARGCITAFAATAVGLPAYVTALWVAKGLLDPALSGAGTAVVSPWSLLAVGAPVAAVAWLRSPGAVDRWPNFQRALYVLALNASTVTEGRPRVRKPRQAPRAHPSLITSTESAGHS